MTARISSKRCLAGLVECTLISGRWISGDNHAGFGLSGVCY